MTHTAPDMHDDSESTAPLKPVATGPFVDRIIRIFKDRPSDDTSALVLLDYAKACSAAHLSASPAPQEQGVKGLEWTGPHMSMWVAEPLSGFQYRIMHDGRGHDAYSWFVGGVWTPAPTLDAAKAAAQTDYEARILSALVEPKIQPPAEVERKVTKALEKAWTDFCDANPDDLTSPEDLPNHALMTCAQFVDYATLAFTAPAVPADELVERLNEHSDTSPAFSDRHWQEVARALLTEAAPAPPATGWQDISTAPKDEGELVWLWYPEANRGTEGLVYSYRDGSLGTSSSFRGMEASHWRPLPTPPNGGVV